MDPFTIFLLVGVGVAAVSGTIKARRRAALLSTSRLQDAASQVPASIAEPVEAAATAAMPTLEEELIESGKAALYTVIPIVGYVVAVYKITKEIKEARKAGRANFAIIWPLLTPAEQLEWARRKVQALIAKSYEYDPHRRLKAHEDAMVAGYSVWAEEQMSERIRDNDTYVRWYPTRPTHDQAWLIPTRPDVGKKRNPEKPDEPVGYMAIPGQQKMKAPSQELYAKWLQTKKVGDFNVYQKEHGDYYMTYANRVNNELMAAAHGGRAMVDFPYVPYRDVLDARILEVESAREALRLQAEAEAEAQRVAEVARLTQMEHDRIVAEQEAARLASEAAFREKHLEYAVMEEKTARLEAEGAVTDPSMVPYLRPRALEIYKEIV